MRTFEEYRFTIRHTNIVKNNYKYHPKDKDELIEDISKEIDLQGYKADLNCIDTSKITDTSFVFCNSDFNGNINTWDVSNVIDMDYMFSDSKFNGDISNWNVSNVTSANDMFANSCFNKDINSWDVSNVKDMRYMFYNSKFNKDISSWVVSKKFTKYDDMFTDCRIKEEYKPKFN